MILSVRICWANLPSEGKPLESLAERASPLALSQATIPQNATSPRRGIIRGTMTTDERGEAHLQRQIDDLKKRIDEIYNVLRDLIEQLSATRLYRPPG